MPSFSVEGKGKLKCMYVLSACVLYLRLNNRAFLNNLWFHLSALKTTIRPDLQFVHVLTILNLQGISLLCLFHSLFPHQVYGASVSTGE